MRLKAFNIKESSKTYTSIQREFLTGFSENIEKLGMMFDSIIELENFLTENIVEEISNLIKFRSNREKIEKEQGKEKYLDKFKEYSNLINDRIEEVKADWDSSHEDVQISRLKFFLDSSIKIHSSMGEILQIVPNFSSVKLLDKMMQQFKRFKVIYLLFEDKITTRINLILDVQKDVEISEKEEKTNVVELSIDDL